MLDTKMESLSEERYYESQPRLPANYYKSPEYTLKLIKNKMEQLENLVSLLEKQITNS